MFLKSRMVMLGIIALNPLMAFAVEANVAATQYHPQAATTSTSSEQAQDDQATSTTVAAKVKKTGKYKDQPCPKFTWAGPYVGLFAGGGWGSSDLNSNTGVVTASSYFTSGANIASVSRNSTGTVSPKGILGGIQIGNNVQSGYFVYGGVADYGSFRLSDSKSASNVTYPTTAGQYNVKSYMSTSWLATLRARLGLTFSETSPSPLVFVTGGVGITNLHVYNSFSDNTAAAGVGGATNTKTKIGWVASAGVEYPFATNWTVDGQYEYVNFGSTSANGFVTCRGGACSATRSPFSTAANLNASIVRFGVNYKL